MKKILLPFLLPFITIISGTWAQQAFPNGDFENWYDSPYGNQMPSAAHWFNTDSAYSDYTGIYQSSDAYSGNHALGLRSFDSGGVRKSADTWTGICCDVYGQPIGTLPYNDKPKFFGFYYKYVVEKEDSAVFTFRFTDSISGTSLGYHIAYLPPADSYRKMVIPLQYSGTPGYVMLRFSGTKSSDLSAKLGESHLYIDSLFFTNDTSEQSVGITLKDIPSFQLYPNPVKDELYLAADGSQVPKYITICDFMGRIIFSRKLSAHGARAVTINTRDWSDGIYFLKVSCNDGNHWLQHIVKQ